MKSEEPGVAAVLDPRILRRMAGVRSFERGEDYFAGGQVGTLAVDRSTITAKVRGARTYTVKLWAESGDLDYSCTCPVGGDGAFCKHCVAVGLAWLDGLGRGRQKVSKKPAKLTVTMDDVRVFLAAQDKRALVNMLVERAMDDDRLRQRLLMQAARKTPKGLDLTPYRHAIDAAVDPNGFVDYQDAYDYARGIDDAVDAVEELFKDGHAAAAIELAEHALERLEDAIGSVDDSDGDLSLILDRLQDVHLKACRKAKPDPEELARRLFEWELHTEWDVFYGAAQTYARILGPAGLAVYRELAEAEWARVPELKPGQDDREKYGKRSRITHMMESLARVTGDVEAVVAVKARDLSSAWNFLQIAETYKKERKHGQALEWAERGLQAFPERTDSRLREFLANEYHRRKRHDEALALVWADFEDAARLEKYKNLKTHADRAGRWTEWREKALALIRQEIGKKKAQSQKQRWAWHAGADGSDLVRIFLWEGNVDAAWQEAQTSGCSDSLWMELAAKREKAHPADAIPIYQREIELVLKRKDNPAYREAVGLLRKIHALMARLGRQSDFARYLESVRAAHKPKRNFMGLLDRAKWT